MRNQRKTNDWIRFALKCGLLVTDASVWAALNHLLNERSQDVRGTFPRTDNLATDVRTHRRWSPASALLTGVGVGIGLGMLLAPVSGQRARGAIRNKAAEVKNRVAGVTHWAGRFDSERPRMSGSYAR